MSYIKASEHRFINSAHIVEFTYTEKRTEQRKRTDKADYNMRKTVQHEVASDLSIVLTVGKPLSFSGPEADRIHAEIIALHAT